MTKQNARTYDFYYAHDLGILRTLVMSGPGDRWEHFARGTPRDTVRQVRTQ